MDEFIAEQLSKYPVSVRAECIDFERWFAIIRTDPEFIKDKWKDMLKYECKRIDRFLYPLFSATLPTSWIGHLSMVNKTIFYEVCHDLYFKLGVPAIDYYDECVHRRKFKFTRVLTSS